jgi:hypothetical protein
MSRAIRMALVFCAAIGLSMLLSGCFFDSSVESLYALPRLPEEYTDLEQQIDSLLSAGMEYAPPTGGSNTQSVQMADLDGDGEEEAIAFFRKSNDEKPLKIYVFHSVDGVYRTQYVVESSGTTINSLYYRDIDSDGQMEIIVGWKISADVQAVAVYRGVGDQAEELMRSSYSRFTLLDIDNDSRQELMVLRTDSEGNGVAECYGWKVDSFSVQYSCQLSMTMAELTAGNIVAGKLESSVPALFITGVSDAGEATTDILVFREPGSLVNVALDSKTGVSRISVPNLAIKPQDINGDGLIEIPSVASTYSGVKFDSSDCVVVWRAYGLDGSYTEVQNTFYDRTSGWYFVLPSDWSGTFSAVPQESGVNENTIAFQLDGKTVLLISTITGENRENRATRGNRVILQRQTEAIYAGELLRGDLGMDETLMKKNFHLILNEWISSDL